MKLHQFFREYRLSQNMTLTEFCKQAGCSKPYWSRKETGKRRLNIDDIDMFRDVFDLLGMEALGLEYDD